MSNRRPSKDSRTSASSSTNLLRGRPTNPWRERRNWWPHRGHSTSSPARLFTPMRSRHDRQNVCVHGKLRGLERTWTKCKRNL